MTWAEFCIRQHAYRRMDKSEWYKVREIAYAAIVGSHLDPKKLPKNQEAFMSLDGGKKDVTDIMKQTIKQAQERFKKEQAKSGK